VTSELAYYSKIQENVPKIEYLDDEAVTDGFFERKIEEAKRLNLIKTTKPALPPNILNEATFS
jgi:hypothetical protein